MTRLGHWLASLLTLVGILLVLMGASYWLLGLRGGVTRSFPTPKELSTQRTLAGLQEAVTTVTTTITGVRDIPVPILTYHYVRDGIDPNQDGLGYQLSISPDLFARQLDALQKAGFTAITPTQFLRGEVNESSIIVSFDDGYRDFYQNAFPALQRRGMTAVAFIVSGFIDGGEGRYMTGDEIREIRVGGIEIGAHTVSHPNLTSLEPLDLQKELLESRFTLEKLIEDRVISVAYPSGEYTDEVVNMAQFSGYRFGVTTDSGVARLADPHLTLPRLSVRPDDTPERLVERIREAKLPTKEGTALQ